MGCFLRCVLTRAPPILPPNLRRCGVSGTAYTYIGGIACVVTPNDWTMAFAFFEWNTETRVFTRKGQIPAV